MLLLVGCAGEVTPGTHGVGGGEPRNSGLPFYPCLWKKLPSCPQPPAPAALHESSCAITLATLGIELAPLVGSLESPDVALCGSLPYHVGLCSIVSS